MRAVRRAHFAALVLVVVCLAGCGAPAPPPAPAPEPPPAAAPEPKVEAPVGNVRVTASALNVRREPTTTGEVLAQMKRGETLALLESGESWSKVRLANGENGWVASRFVEAEGASKSAKKSTPAKRKSGCPADSDFAFVETPTLAFSDSGAHGIVVVEANVNTKGVVTSTKVVSNNTGDESLAFLAQREIKAARFSPPIRNCVPRAFVFTYRRTY